MKEDLTVVAGGWSVQNVGIDRLCGRVIGVNDAAFFLPRVDIVVSMDRLWTEYRWGWLLERGQETWLRRSAVQNLPAAEMKSAARWLHVFECDNNSDQFTVRKNWLNGPNSGAVALNLAWRMKPTRVFLLGFDMNRDKHGRASWHPPYPWTPPTGATPNGKYAQWAKQLNKAALAFSAQGTEVLNVSPSSSITVFPKMTPAQFAKECG